MVDKKKENPKAMLTVMEVAEELAISVPSIRYEIHSGRLKGHKFFGEGGYRVKREDLDAFVDSRVIEQIGK